MNHNVMKKRKTIKKESDHLNFLSIVIRINLIVNLHEIRFNVIEVCQPRLISPFVSEAIITYLHSKLTFILFI